MSLFLTADAGGPGSLNLKRKEASVDPLHHPCVIANVSRCERIIAMLNLLFISREIKFSTVPIHQLPDPLASFQAKYFYHFHQLKWWKKIHGIRTGGRY